MVHVMASTNLAGAAMTASVMCDDAEPTIEEEEHVRVPIVGGKRPAVAEHNRLPAAPVLVEDLHAVFGGNRGHDPSPKLYRVPRTSAVRSNSCSWPDIDLALA